MKIRIGDRVRFLNAMGGGIVRSMKGKDVLYVEGDDGFEIPVLARECVLIEAGDLYRFEDETAAASSVEVVAAKVEPEPDTLSLALNKEGIKPGQLQVALAFLPTEPKRLSESRYELYLVNDSYYTLSVVLSVGDGDGAELLYCGEVSPNSALFVEEFGKEDLNLRQVIRVQTIAYATKGVYRALPVVDRTMKVDVVKFYKLHSFVENDYFEDPAIIYYVRRAVNN